MAKGKGFISEFKTFIMRGNVIDLAVGVIIGGAFQKIVNSLVNDIVMPLISLLTGGIDFSNWFLVLGEGEFATAAAAKEAGVATLNYGTFLSTALDFLIMAFVIFLIIKGINSVTEKFKKEKTEEPAAPTTKVCPYCKSEIDIAATKCPHCTSDVE
ncbi:MAG: large conductance mechanosensitive channel protein MscL [Ruminococcus sp.]|nr:large conductance mechanosensitive channel protein MscL [Ruminococcus sp.]